MNDYTYVLTSTDSDRRLRKKIVRHRNGNIEVAGYSAGQTFDAIQWPVSNIHDLFELNRNLLDQDAFYIRGMPRAHVTVTEEVDEHGDLIRRANGVNRGFKDDYEGGVPDWERRSDCHWFTIDEDGPDKKGIPLIGTAHETVEAWVLAKMPPQWHDVTYFAGLSSTSGIDRTTGAYPNGMLKFHITFWAKEPIDDARYEQWLKETGIADPSTLRPTQPCYVARPIFEGMTDPVPEADRLWIVRKGSDEIVGFVPPVQPPKPFTYTPPPSSGTQTVTPFSWSNFDPKSTAHALALFRAYRGHLPANALTTLRDLHTSPFAGPAMLSKARHGGAETLTLCNLTLTAQIALVGFYDADLTLDFLKQLAVLKGEKRTERWLAKILNKGIAWAQTNVTPMSWQPQAQTSPSPPSAERDEIWEFIEGACGEGKTQHALRSTAERGGLVLYATDSRANVRQRKKEFEAILNDRPGGTQGWMFRAIHSEYDPDDDAKRTTVASEITSFRKTAEDDASLVGAIAFVTHAALHMMTWAGWRKWRLIVDETTDALGIYKRCFPTTKDSLLVPHLIVDESATDDPDGFLPVKITEQGFAVVDQNIKDNGLDAIRPLLTKANEVSNRVEVQRLGWMDPNEQMIFRWVLSPDHYRPFAERLFMADEFSKSALYNVFEKVHGIAWTPAPFKPLRRLVPLSKRVKIRYFFEGRVSFAKLESASRPLERIAPYIRDKYGDRSPLVATNRGEREYHEYFTGKGSIAKLPDEDVLTPKSVTGLNHLRDRTVTFWLASMRQDHTLVKYLCDAAGFTTADVRRCYEFNPAYQFTLRGVLRNFASDEVQTCYFIDRETALYFAERVGLTEADIEHVAIVREPELKKPGRKPNGEQAMTAAEKQRAYRERKKAASAPTPEPEPIADDEIILPWDVPAKPSNDDIRTGAIDWHRPRPVPVDPVPEVGKVSHMKTKMRIAIMHDPSWDGTPWRCLPKQIQAAVGGEDIWRFG